MNIISSIKVLSFLSLVIISGWLAGCAAPKVYAPLQSLKEDYQRVSQDEVKRTSAPVTLYEVEGLIKKAEDAAELEDDELVAHTTYLGRKKLEVALAKAQQKHYDALTKTLSEQRNMLLIEARTKEAQSFKQEAQSSRLEAETFREQAEMSKLEAEAARTSLETYKSKETSRGTVLVLDDLLFDSGGAALHLGSQKNLDPLIHYLQESPRRKVTIGGHTDSVGEDAYNQTLSLRRADAVRDYLIRSGIDENRIITRGHGEFYPVATNSTREGRQLNRRVEILIKN